MKKKKGKKVSGNIELPHEAVENRLEKLKSIHEMLNRIVGDLNPYFTLIASTVVILSFILFALTYFPPYVVSSETYREYSPEDYLMGASLNTPNYTLKTTEIVTVKPTSLFNCVNRKTFYLPEKSYNVRINPSDNYDSEIVGNNEKIIFHFHKNRYSMENIEISYSYKQKKNPSVILLDYNALVESNQIEENLILENTENAKITSFRANWIINEDENDWNIENIQNNPDAILFETYSVIPKVNKTTLGGTNVLIYSWDMNFDKNEIKPIKILTHTNVNYTLYSLEVEYLRVEPAFEMQFPYNEDNFEWVFPEHIIPNFPYENSTGYIDGSSIRMFPYPLNSTVFFENIKRWNNQGKLKVR